MIVNTNINYDPKFIQIEQRSNEEKFSNEKIYWKIHICHFQKPSELKKQCWNCLSSHKIRNLKQLLQHKELIRVFDAFLNMSVFLNEMRISILHKLLMIKCDEIVFSPLMIWKNSFVIKKSYIILITQIDFDSIYYSMIKLQWSKWIWSL